MNGQVFWTSFRRCNVCKSRYNGSKKKLRFNYSKLFLHCHPTRNSLTRLPKLLRIEKQATIMILSTGNCRSISLWYFIDRRIWRSYIWTRRRKRYFSHHAVVKVEDSEEEVILLNNVQIKKTIQCFQFVPFWIWCFRFWLWICFS